MTSQAVGSATRSGSRPSQGAVGLPIADGWAVGWSMPSILAGVALAGAIVVAMAAGSGPLETVAAFAAVLLAIVSPSAGLLVLSFMAILQPPAGVPAPGFASIMVVALLLGCVYRLPIDRPQPRANMALLLLGAAVLFVSVQQLPEMATGYSGQQAHAVGYLYFQLLTGFGFVLAAIWVLSGRSPYPALAMGLGGATLAALIALVPYLFPVVAGPFLNLSGNSADITRASGPFSNPNFMGGSVGIAFGAAVAMASLTRGRVYRVVLVGGAVLLGAAVAISLSRGALIVVFSALAWLALARGRGSALAVIGLGLAGALVIYPAFVEWRLINLTGSASAAAFEVMARSDEGRLGGLLASVPLFLSSPIVGVGFGHYLAASVEVAGSVVAIGAHNWYAYVLAEQGIVGITIWILVLGAIAVELQRRPSGPRSFGIAVFTAMAVACLFLEAPTSFQTIALPSLFLVAALAGDWQPRPQPHPGGPMARPEAQLVPEGVA